MFTYKMKLSYDGTRYRGWQRQQNTKDTIQDIVENVLKKIIGHNVHVNGSGRTDRGVHAYEQVASFCTGAKLQTRELEEQMNAELPHDIRVHKISQVENGFHARKSAVSKCYEYHVDTAKKQDVFERKYSFSFPEELDVKKMKRAAWYLQGTHDFTSFTDLKDSEDTVRTIEKIEIIRQGEKLIFLYLGDGFLYHMVRILTGTLLDVGRGNIDPEEIPAILQMKDRRASGFPAPAKGLFLKQVYYRIGM